MKKIKKILICLLVLSMFGVVTPTVMADELGNSALENGDVSNNQNGSLDDGVIDDTLDDEQGVVVTPEAGGDTSLEEDDKTPVKEDGSILDFLQNDIVLVAIIAGALVLIVLIIVISASMKKKRKNKKEEVNNSEVVQNVTVQNVPLKEEPQTIETPVSEPVIEPVIENKVSANFGTAIAQPEIIKPSYTEDDIKEVKDVKLDEVKEEVKSTVQPMPNIFETPVVNPKEEVNPTVQPMPNIFETPVVKPIEEVKPTVQPMPSVF
ncbi:MAG: hypothetical protein IJZ36_04715 [Bacilli bacterium]|nr:hypothetical protein [Bacilli bacterium]